MKKINIYFVYNQLGTNKQSFKGHSYYENNKYDEIEITHRSISISGYRGNNSKANNILTNINSTFYRQLLKGIVYVYLTQGERFNIGEIRVTCGEEIETYSYSEIINPCVKDLHSELTVDKKKCAVIFGEAANVNDLLIAMILFIKGIEENSFDFFWKSFNSLYSCISSHKTEIDKLVDMKKFIQTNQVKFMRTMKKIENDTVEDIRSLRLREFVLNNFDTIQKTNSYAEMVKSFEDYRLNKLFKDVMPYREAFLKSEGLYTSVSSHVEKNILVGKKNNFDLLRFYILKYAYFLRNKYFHAEKSYPVFVLRKNNEIEEINKINTIMVSLLVDLFNCCDLYI